jgi:hypothetical protein
MTGDQILAFGVASGSIIGALTAGVIAIIAALRKQEASRSADAVKADAKSDILIGKADQIHTLADGNLSRVSSDLKVALESITRLEARVASMAEAKAVADKVAENLAAKVPPST